MGKFNDMTYLRKITLVIIRSMTCKIRAEVEAGSQVSSYFSI